MSTFAPGEGWSCSLILGDFQLPPCSCSPGSVQMRGCGNNEEHAQGKGILHPLRSSPRVLRALVLRLGRACIRCGTQSLQASFPTAFTFSLVLPCWFIPLGSDVSHALQWKKFPRDSPSGKQGSEVQLMSSDHKHPKARREIFQFPEGLWLLHFSTHQFNLGAICSNANVCFP